LNENTGQDTKRIGSQENGASNLIGMLHDLTMATACSIISMSSGLSGFINGGIAF